MNWTRLTVQSQARPLPQFESENVGSGADLEDHAFRAGTMHGAGGNQKMIVLGGGKAIDEAIGVEGNLAILRFAELSGHRLRIGVCAQAEIDGGSWAGIEHVVAFVLGVVHAESVLNIFGERVDLE